MLYNDLTIEHLSKQPTPLIEPFKVNRLSPCSYDLTIGDELLIPRFAGVITADTKQHYTSRSRQDYMLMPHEFVLATTNEVITLPENVQARVDGKSSIGRLGLFVQNAGFIDPGFTGTITLELYNATHSAMDLSSFDRIAQISFYELNYPPLQPYHGKYQCQNGTTGSMEYKDH